MTDLLEFSPPQDVKKYVARLPLGRTRFDLPNPVGSADVVVSLYNRDGGYSFSSVLVSDDAVTVELDEPGAAALLPMTLVLIG